MYEAILVHVARGNIHKYARDGFVQGACQIFRRDLIRQVAGLRSTRRLTLSTRSYSPSPLLTSPSRRWGTWPDCRPLRLNKHPSSSCVYLSQLCSPFVFCPMYKTSFPSRTPLCIKRYFIQDPSPSNGKNLQRYHFCWKNHQNCGWSKTHQDLEGRLRIGLDLVV